MSDKRFSAVMTWRLRLCGWMPDDLSVNFPDTDPELIKAVQQLLEARKEMDAADDKIHALAIAAGWVPPEPEDQE